MGSTPWRPTGKSLTKGAFQESTDINAIMKRYMSTGMFPMFSGREPRYGDFSSVTDYRECLHRVMEAQEAFDALPAEVRQHFMNDPAELLGAVMDPGRRAELEALGLVEREEQKASPEADSPREAAPSKQSDS